MTSVGAMLSPYNVEDAKLIQLVSLLSGGVRIHPKFEDGLASHFAMLGVTSTEGASLPNIGTAYEVVPRTALL